MNRRDFLRTLTATPAAFLVGKYGMPGGGEVPKVRHYDPEAIQISWAGIDLRDLIPDGKMCTQVEMRANHVALVDRVVGDGSSPRHTLIFP